MQIVVGNLRARPWAVGVWAVDPRVLGSLLSFPVGLGAGLVIVSCDRDLDRPAISNTPAQWARRLWASRGGPQGEKEITWGGCNMGHIDVFLSRRRCLRHLQKKKRKKKKRWRGLQSLSRLFLFTPDSSPFKFCLGPVAGNRGTGPSAQSWLLKIRVEQGRIPPAVSNLKCSRNKQGRPGRRGRGLHHGTAAFT